MKSVSHSIAQILGNNGVIKIEDIDICKYGLEIFLASMLEIISILVISVFAENFLETLLFFGAFVPLRIYAGGYHADTKIKCYLVSLAVYGLFTLILNITPPETYMVINLFSAIFSLIIVFILAPVIHRNKSVNEAERMHYKKISRGICVIETSFIILLTVALPDSRFVCSLVLGQSAVTIAMIVAIVKNKILKINKII